jgi:hypothetical protein
MSPTKILFSPQHRKWAIVVAHLRNKCQFWPTGNNIYIPLFCIYSHVLHAQHLCSLFCLQNQCSAHNAYGILWLLATLSSSMVRNAEISSLKTFVPAIIPGNRPAFEIQYYHYALCCWCVWISCLGSNEPCVVIAGPPLLVCLDFLFRVQWTMCSYSWAAIVGMFGFLV